MGRQRRQTEKKTHIETHAANTKRENEHRQERMTDTDMRLWW